MKDFIVTLIFLLLLYYGVTWMTPAARGDAMLILIVLAALGMSGPKKCP